MIDTKRMELRRDVPLAGPSEYGTYREVWNIHARPAIRYLITSNNTELYLSACTLTVPWMDRCYTICQFGYDKARYDPKSLMNKYTAKDIVEFIYYDDSEESQKFIVDVWDHLANVFNSLKHDGYLRQGYAFDPRFNWLIGHAFDGDLARFAEITRISESFVQIQSLVISPKTWVNSAVKRIDQLFIDAKILD